jgi:predicted nucleic acid-binding protein
VGFLRAIAVPAVVYIDSCTLIYSVEKVSPYWPALRELWVDAGKGDISLCVSEIVLAEVLVGPLKYGNQALVAAFEELFDQDITLVPITQPVLRVAAQLRADTGLRTPDAIHAATALETGCAAFLTNDRAFTRVLDLPVHILRDLLPA